MTAPCTKTDEIMEIGQKIDGNQRNPEYSRARGQPDDPAAAHADRPQLNELPDASAELRTGRGPHGAHFPRGHLALA